MTDELAGLVGDKDASASSPASPPIDIEARLAQMQQDFEERIKGFQTLVNRKDQELKDAQREARELREASMSEDERKQFRAQERDAELEDLRQQNLLLTLAREYPDEVPIFEDLLNQNDPKSQLELIRKIRQANAAAASNQEPAPEPEPDIPPTDPNNPRTSFDYTSDGLTFNGRPVTEDWANNILKNTPAGAFR